MCHWSNVNRSHNIDSEDKLENRIQQDYKVDNNDDRISISISRKAHDALLEHTKQLNKENETQRPSTVEEVCMKKSFYCLVMSRRKVNWQRLGIQKKIAD
jgi:hypothetical protein